MNCYNNAIFYRTIETIHRWIGRTDTELLKDGEVGLVDGAYELARDEAIKRKLVIPDTKIPEANANLKPEQKKSFKWWNRFFEICISAFLFVCFQQYIQHRDLVNNPNEVVDTRGMTKATINEMTPDEKARLTEVLKMVINEMTDDERVKYISVIKKSNEGTATRQEMIDNGKLLLAVAGRMPIDKKAIWKKFFGEFKHTDYGNKFVDALNP